MAMYSTVSTDGVNEIEYFWVSQPCYTDSCVYVRMYIQYYLKFPFPWTAPVILSICYILRLQFGILPPLHQYETDGRGIIFFIS